MKKIQVILSAIALFVAVTGAFITQAHNSMLVDKPGLILDTQPLVAGNQSDCRVGTLEANACTADNTHPQCTVSITSFGSNNPAFTTDDGASCSGPIYRNP